MADVTQVGESVMLTAAQVDDVLEKYGQDPAVLMEMLVFNSESLSISFAQANRLIDSIVKASQPADELNYQLRHIVCADHLALSSAALQELIRYTPVTVVNERHLVLTDDHWSYIIMSAARMRSEGCMAALLARIKIQGRPLNQANTALILSMLTLDELLADVYAGAAMPVHVLTRKPPLCLLTHWVMSELVAFKQQDSHLKGEPQISLTNQSWHYWQSIVVPKIERPQRPVNAPGLLSRNAMNKLLAHTLHEICKHEQAHSKVSL